MFKFSSRLRSSIPGLTKHIFESKALPTSTSFYNLSKSYFSNQTNPFKSVQNKNPFLKNKETPKPSERLSLSDAKNIFEELKKKKDDGSLAREEAEDYLGLAMDLGSMAQAHVDYNEAERYYREGISAASKANIKNQNLIKVFNNLGVLYFNQGNLNEAMDNLTQAKDLMETLNSENVDHMLERNMLVQGLIHKAHGKENLAINLFNEMIRIMEENPVQSLVKIVISPYQELGSIYCSQGEYNKGLQTLERGVEFVTKNFGEIPKIDELYQTLVDEYREFKSPGAIQKSLKYTKAIINYKEKNGGLNIRDIYLAGYNYYAVESYDDEALKYFNQFLNLSSNNPDLKGARASVYQSLFMIQFGQDNIKEGKESFAKCVSLSKEIYGIYHKEVFKVYLRICQEFFSNHELLTCYTAEVKEIAENMKRNREVDQEILSKALYWSACLSLMQEDFSTSVRYFEECINHKCESILDVNYKFNLYYFMGMAYLNSGMYPQAKTYLEKGIQLCKEQNLPQERIEKYRKIMAYLPKKQAN